MTSKPLADKAIVLDRRDILALMKRMGAQSLLGVDLAETGIAGTPDEEAAKDSLKAKGILGSSGKKENIAPGMLPMVSALLFPERAILAVRDVPEIGKQVLVFLHKDGTTILHSFPKDGQHCLAAFPEPSDVMQFLLDWFPLYVYPHAAARFLLPKTVLESARMAAEQGRRDEAVAALRESNADPAEKQALVDAFSSRRISGSFALVTCKDGEITDGRSFAVVGGDDTCWWISGGERQDSAEMFTVERTGSDFTIKMQSLAGQLTGAPLAVSKIGKEKKITKYMLSADEFALSLASINMPESGLGFLASIYGSMNEAEFQGRIQAAGQSLTDRGLATRTPKGIPSLTPDLQYALLPAVRFDSMIRIRMIRGAKKSEAVLYRMKGKSFTARFDYGGAMQVLETGKEGDLPSYLLDIFSLAGEGEKKEISDNAGEIPLDALSHILDDGADPARTEKILAAAGFPAKSTKLLAEDLAHNEFRGLLEKKTAGDKPGELPQDAPLSALLLLKAPQRNWLFHFPVADNQARTEAKIIQKQGFQSALADFLKA